MKHTRLIFHLFALAVFIWIMHWAWVHKPGQVKAKTGLDTVKHSTVPYAADIAPEGDTIIWIENHSEIK